MNRRINALLLSGALCGCATLSAPPTGLDGVVRGPATLCFEQTAFDLPTNGTIVEASAGRFGVTLTGSIGPKSFEITESGNFTPTDRIGPELARNDGLLIRQVGNDPGAFAVFAINDTGAAAERPVVRIEHRFGTQSTTLEAFMAGFRRASSAATNCARRFSYG